MEFDGRLAGLSIAVHNLGRPGEAIVVQSLRLERALKYRDRRRPAAVLFYSGHNERFLFRHSLLFGELLCAAENRWGHKTVWNFDDYRARLCLETAVAAQKAGAITRAACDACLAAAP